MNNNDCGNKIDTFKAFGGGYHTFASIVDAHHLKGKSKYTQLKAICDAHNLDVEAVITSKSYSVRKSRNLPYHPATYMLDVRHDTLNELRRR